MGQHEQLFCSLDTEGGPGMGEGHTFRAADGRTRFNLLGWDGRGDAPDLFPERGTP